MAHGSYTTKLGFVLDVDFGSGLVVLADMNLVGTEGDTLIFEDVGERSWLYFIELTVVEKPFMVKVKPTKATVGDTEDE